MEENTEIENLSAEFNQKEIEKLKSIKYIKQAL